MSGVDMRLMLAQTFPGHLPYMAAVYKILVISTDCSHHYPVPPVIATMKLLSFVLTTILSISGLATAVTPGTCTGTCQGYSHDPAIMRRVSDGTYFRFSTAGKINVATSSSLQGPWTLKGSALPAGSIIANPGSNGIFQAGLLITGKELLTADGRPLGS